MRRAEALLIQKRNFALDTLQLTRAIKPTGTFTFGQFAPSQATTWMMWDGDLTATSHRDKGWLAEIAHGAPSLPGEWAVSYAYAHIKADAVLSAFSDSDFTATNVKGHRFSLSRALSRNKMATLTLFHTTAVDDTLAPGGGAGIGRDTNKLQFDIQAKF